MSGVMILALFCMTFSMLHVTYDLGEVWESAQTKVQNTESHVIVKFAIIGLLFAGLLSVGVFYLARWIENRQIEPGRVFVDNSRPLSEISNDSAYTQAAITRLERSSKYQRFQQVKGNDKRNWNWQTRESEGVSSDSDDEI